MTAMIARRQPMPTFTGGEELLDQLIAASSAHKMPHATTSPVARTLVPYFPTSAEASPNLARPSGKRVGNGAASPPKTRPCKDKKSRANSPPSAAHPKAPESHHRPATRPASPAAGTPKHGFWAGPGYVVSPKPDMLPIPPPSLLQRA